MVDPGELFGEGWCLTVAPGTVAGVLERMGVTGASAVPGGLDAATERLVEGGKEGVLLLGHEVGAGWVMVVELEGTTGWVGADPSVLTELSVGGATVVSVCEDPDGLMVHIARDGTVLGWLDAFTGRRFGDAVGDIAQELTVVGFPEGEGGPLTSPAWDLGGAGRALLAVRALTGAEVTEEDFEGLWTGGVSHL
ncbi:DUF6461 domain-containing protein [Streptomyces pakalii]|uniref:DUF6461 domain-containing protein n=1 Tax=Streptomyces pakalii TaxID=3036494 RepID=A0ABT7DLU0_9ACTN|nr:DUF6461 domain-containing protein [Streptomyces pakalii]MDJ1645426.1 DUF6461 domain-containing protein [Streptomyces pakalii]